LGVSSEFSTLDALKNEERLDSDLVSKLLVRHSSGLNVLAAADEYDDFQPSATGVIKLINILRLDFDWLVVDAGNRFTGYGASLFELAEKVYLVTQVSVAELRNSKRFVAAFFPGAAACKLEVILNRYAVRAGAIDDQSIAKALTVAPAWKIPNDYEAVHSAENTATPLALQDGAIGRALVHMARAICGKAEEGSKKKRRFSLFG
jgi:pilus assembly protein CpaE